MLKRTQNEQQILLPNGCEILNGHSEKPEVTHLLQARPASGGTSFWRLLPSLNERLRWKGQTNRLRPSGALFLQQLPMAPGFHGLTLAPGSPLSSSRDAVQQGTVQQAAPALPGILSTFFCFPGQNNGRAGLRSF